MRTPQLFHHLYHNPLFLSPNNIYHQNPTFFFFHLIYHKKIKKAEREYLLISRELTRGKEIPKSAENRRRNWESLLEKERGTCKLSFVFVSNNLGRAGNTKAWLEFGKKRRETKVKVVWIWSRSRWCVFVCWAHVSASKNATRKYFFYWFTQFYCDVQNSWQWKTEISLDSQTQKSQNILHDKY